MSETARTAAFAAAAVLVAAAAFFTTAGPATTAAGFEQVGTPFYEGFDSLAEVGTFAVTAFDGATGEIRDFKVTRDADTGVYGIAPYDYPAEAAEKLGETAAALSGVKRAALKSRRPADWADLGVVDPASEDVGELEGRGLRVALTGTDGNVLADLIIGNPVEDRDGFYYVRAPRDDSTYIAEVDLDLSARFADWVDPKVLGVEADDLRRVVVPDEAIAESGPPRLIVGGDPLVLTREESFGQWSAEGLAEGKQVKQAAANELARTAAGLTVVGVRPKPEGLNPDLTVDPAVVKSQLQFDLIAQNIAGKGFSIVGTDDGGAQVVGGAGQLTVAAEDGVTFDLDFGELFTGTEYDVAVGDFGDRPTTVGEGAGNDAEDEGDDAGSQSRYLFVTARLDESLLGDPPTAPTPPADDADAEAADGGTDAETDDADDAETPQQVFERETREYKAAKKDYDAKLKAARERVADLNERFGDWYYVIDAADVADLTLSRDALIEDAPADDDSAADDGDGGGGPALPALSAPGERPTLIPPSEPATGEDGVAADDADDEDAEAADDAPALPMPAASAGKAASGETPEPAGPAGGGGAGGPDGDRQPVVAPKPAVPAAAAPDPPGDAGGAGPEDEPAAG